MPTSKVTTYVPVRASWGPAEFATEHSACVLGAGLAGDEDKVYLIDYGLACRFWCVSILGRMVTKRLIHGVGVYLD